MMMRGRDSESSAPPGTNVVESVLYGKVVPGFLHIAELGDLPFTHGSIHGEEVHLPVDFPDLEFIDTDYDRSFASTDLCNRRRHPGCASRTYPFSMAEACRPCHQSADVLEAFFSNSFVSFLPRRIPRGIDRAGSARLVGDICWSEGDARTLFSLGRASASSMLFVWRDWVLPGRRQGPGGHATIYVFRCRAVRVLPPSGCGNRSIWLSDW